MILESYRKSGLDFLLLKKIFYEYIILFVGAWSIQIAYMGSLTYTLLLNRSILCY